MPRREAAWRGYRYGLLAVPVLIALLLTALTRWWPQHVPWTALDLGQPLGAFTGRKLTALGEDPAACRALLTRADIQFDQAPLLGGSDGQCRVADAVMLAGGARKIVLRPNSPALSCPVAGAMALWEWHVVQPAAQAVFDQRVASIRHLGSYNCRRMYGRADAPWSEHARANALDIAGFTLADGTEIMLKRDWFVPGRKAEFLRRVRDGACDVFAVVLSPDYNAAHADHFHLDQSARGAWGWRSCR